MATEEYIRDQAEFLTAGNLSDLTLLFGDRARKVHKALVCCHSKWFRNAITGDFKEGISGTLNLQDDLEFEDAIDCMVSYFYEASYNASKYTMAEALLHAQVAILSDKYECASLCNLARASFEKSLGTIQSDEWIAVARFVYENTTSANQYHVDLQRLVVAVFVDKPSIQTAALWDQSVNQLFRSNADLATDLLLSRPYSPKIPRLSGETFICDDCKYVHIGSPNCLRKASNWSPTLSPHCNICSGRHGRLLPITPCPTCDGVHAVTGEDDRSKGYR